MARKYTLVCDACEKRENAKIKVYSVTGKRDDGYRFTADLCSTCWKRMEAEFGISEESRYQRDTYEVIDFDDIERA